MIKYLQTKFLKKLQTSPIKRHFPLQEKLSSKPEGQRICLLHEEPREHGPCPGSWRLRRNRSMSLREALAHLFVISVGDTCWGPPLFICVQPPPLGLSPGTGSLGQLLKLPSGEGKRRAVCHLWVKSRFASVPRAALGGSRVHRSIRLLNP